MAIAIDGPIERAPFPFDVDVGFINVPGPPRLPSSLDSSLICHERGKARLRVSDCLVRELEAALENHLSQIAQAQLVPQSPQHGTEDDISGVFERVERRSCTLVESALARSRSRTSESPARFSWFVLW